jgi:hypothetical protein
VENLAILVGPVLTGIALAATSAGVVFAATAVLMVAVTVLLAGVPSHAPPGGRVTTSVVREVVGGFAKAVAPGPSRPIVAVLGAAVIVWGSLDVFLVVIAIDLLAIGEAGVGYLNSALGAGGVIGAAVAVGLVGRRRLAPALIAGTLAWGVGLAALGLSAELVGVLILLLLAGTGRVVMDVAGQTLLQRVTDHRVLARVFGVVEGLRMASMALGSILAPLLIGLLGTTNAILVAGLLPIATALIGARALLRADAAAVVPVENIALLRSNPIFVPLAAPAIELLARRLEPVAYATGSTVITQGEVGDHYYLIESGVAGIVADGRHVTDLRAGDGFGEIALLRDVPRTASVVARESLGLLRLDRATFLEAVTGMPASHAAAEDLMAARIAETTSARDRAI